MLIIRSTRGNGTFGAYTSHKWKDSVDFYGTKDCFLYQLQPSLAIYRPKERGSSNFMYCNSSEVKKPPRSGPGNASASFGIGFGGTTKQPRLYISGSFDKCIAHFRDSTFEDGELLTPAMQNGTFDVDMLEVWGTGGEEVISRALKARSDRREVVDSHIIRSRQVDKKQFLNDFNSGLIESKAFAHREQIRGGAGKSYEVDDHRK